MVEGERERLAYTRALESQNSCRRLQNVLLMIDDGGEYKKSRGLPHLDIRACGAAQGEEALDRSRVFQVPGSSARPPDTVLLSTLWAGQGSNSRFIKSTPLKLRCNYCRNIQRPGALP